MTSGYCPWESPFFWVEQIVFVNYSLSFYISVETTFTDILSVVCIAHQWLYHYPGMCRVQSSSLSGELKFILQVFTSFIFMFYYFRIRYLF